MSDFPWDQTLVGWVHITSAAVVVGFLFTWLLAILPSGEGARAVVGRYRPYFWAAALLLPLTGAYTWYVRTGQGYPGFYFHVLYTKIVLYVVLFGIAGALTKPREASDRRSSGQTLLGVCVVISLVVLFMSAFMRRVKPVAPEVGLSSGTKHITQVVIKKGVAPGWQS